MEYNSNNKITVTFDDNKVRNYEASPLEYAEGVFKQVFEDETKVNIKSVRSVDLRNPRAPMMPVIIQNKVNSGDYGFKVRKHLSFLCFMSRWFIDIIFATQVANVEIEEFIDRCVTTDYTYNTQNLMIGHYFY